MKRVLTSISTVLTWLALSSTQALATSGVVNITPLGSQKGEFCTLDRAMIFEDPNGTRILYDAGRTVAGANDPRLGKIDIILVSHVHGDHIGDKHIKALDAGSCAKPDVSVSDTPASNSVKIAIAKHAKIVTGSEMPSLFAAKLKAAGGDPKDSLLVRFGAMKTVDGVGITTVPAIHSNGLSPDMIEGSLGEFMKGAGLTAHVGPATGYILKFSNGLVVYLSGDTGITAEQDIVVRQHYGAKLAVINIGDTYTTGPTEAAYVINDLVKPTSVIPSHANEEATLDGKVLPHTRTKTFIEATDVPVHVPFSGITMSFDSNGKCIAGC
ncbi:MBL fold metallo-hydrolase [Thiomicrorhabdus sp. ZW0627]|uniref:MBL fold metallo-hydrolase n=1 Tax=Thiomicrorhabdus sp. ZW0627 TaxID=3039774 RepID=UPI002436FB04|nr:MBL fold metallo-hydrolase [Thiomicrorhabdus sp. ZW0627]MDG6772747.1 MBL fold metallo-hydrolase [Thiomicrorhabdus sp. ZW0627]